MTGRRVRWRNGFTNERDCRISGFESADECCFRLREELFPTLGKIMKVLVIKHIITCINGGKIRGSGAIGNEWIRSHHAPFPVAMSDCIKPFEFDEIEKRIRSLFAAHGVRNTVLDVGEIPKENGQEVLAWLALGDRVERSPITRIIGAG